MTLDICHLITCMAVCGTASLSSLRHVYLRRKMNKFHVRNTELGHPPVRKRVRKGSAFSAIFQDNEHLGSIIRLFMNYNCSDWLQLDIQFSLPLTLYATVYIAMLCLRGIIHCVLLGGKGIEFYIYCK